MYWVITMLGGLDVSLQAMEPGSHGYHLMERVECSWARLAG